MQYEQYLFDYYSSYGSNYKYFFTGKIIERNSRKNNLLKGIVDIYKKWLESPFEYGVDLQYFDLNKLKQNLKNHYHREQLNKKTNLNCRSTSIISSLSRKKIAFNQYTEILEKENEFNEKIDEFIEDIKKI